METFLEQADNAPKNLRARGYEKIKDLVPNFWKWYNKTFVELQKLGLENPNPVKQYKLLEGGKEFPVTVQQVECK